jgi:predicted dehydrogenase
MAISVKKNSKIINFAIVGLGITSRYFIEAIKTNPQTHLISVCDIDEKKLLQMKSEKLVFHKNLNNILADDRINTVVVITPNHTHYKIIKACLRSNKNVICEKPLGINYNQTNKLINFADKKKLLLMTAFHRRYNKHLIKIKSNNDIKMINGRYLENIDQHTNCDNWLSDAKKNGGGCIIDNGINVIDAVRSLVGELELKEVSTGYIRKLSKRCDINSKLKFTFKNNGIFNLDLDWKYNGEIKDLSITYSNGEVSKVDFLKGFKEFKSSLKHEYFGVIVDYVNRLKKSNINKDIDSLKASRLIDEIYKKSARF